jgi:hypothetical protein
MRRRAGKHENMFACKGREYGPWITYSALYVSAHSRVGLNGTYAPEVLVSANLFRIVYPPPDTSSLLDSFNYLFQRERSAILEAWSGLLSSPNNRYSN